MSRIPNFGWNRLNLATLTYEQINALEEQVKSEHACSDGKDLLLPDTSCRLQVHAGNQWMLGR
jgi:hypothetical protein